MVLVQAVLPAQSFPPSTNKRRNYIPLVEKTGTQSLPKGAELFAHRQEYRANTLVNYPMQARVSGNPKFTKEEVILHSPGNERQLLESIGVGQGFEQSEWIETHVERRVQLFFLQLIACYKTPFVFSATRAEDEIGGGCTVQMHNPELKTRVIHKTQAAHSSTLPCLYAQSREEAAAPKFVYLKHSHLYNQHNATVELPIYVNQADTYIDETKGLRKEALEIINKAARGEVSPQEGIKKFMLAFTRVLSVSIDSLKEGDLRRTPLEMYLERAVDMELEIREDPGIFDHLLGVKVKGDDASAVLRDVVFAKRFKLIQSTQSIETKIARIILDAQNQMLKKRDKSLRSDCRLRYVLLEKAPVGYRTHLEKLLCTSLDQLQRFYAKPGERLRDCEIRAAEKKAHITKFRADHEEAVKKLEKDLRPLFREMSREELMYRSEVFRGLRVEVRNWTQQCFSDNYRRAYPSDSMSRSMVSRFEGFSRPVDPTRVYQTPEGQRKKVVDIARALKIAATFEVDPGCFLPSLISSSY